MILIIVLVITGLDFYFHFGSNFQGTINNRIHEKIKERHIHPLTFSQIPSMYREAVIATEDRRFWWDPGIDPVGILRSLAIDIQHGSLVQGGSTITQQLIDNTILQRQKTVSYKAHQAFYALGIYDTFSKKQTFTMYANMIYFGNGAYGLYNAAVTYFGKSPKNLNAGELTMLAGLPNSPTVYDPLKHLKLARERQTHVLKNMVGSGVISKKIAQQIFNQPIQLTKP